MTVTRRDLLKRSLAAGSVLGALELLDSPGAAAQDLTAPKTAGAKVVKTICPYCSVGCGLELHVKAGQIVHVKGDPDHPINEGALCSKGASVLNLRMVADANGNYAPNPRRLTKVQYRAPGSDKWEEKDWDWAIGRIAANVKATRDATFERQDPTGVTVNRTFAMAHIGSAALDNEENYLLVKLQRALGLARVEHHARL